MLRPGDQHVGLGDRGPLLSGARSQVMTIVRASAGAAVSNSRLGIEFEPPGDDRDRRVEVRPARSSGLIDAGLDR